MNFLKRHPRLAFLLIGLLVGIFSVLITSRQYNNEINRLEALNERVHTKNEQTIAKLTKEKVTLSEQIKTLKTRTRVKEIKRADGSSEKVFENDTESSSQTKILQQERTIAQLEHSLQSLKRELEFKKELAIRTKPSLGIGVGLSTELVPTVSGFYNFSGNWLLTGSGDRNGVFTLGIGLQF